MEDEQKIESLAQTTLNASRKQRKRGSRLEQGSFVSVKLRNHQANLLIKLAKDLKQRRANATISDFVSIQLEKVEEQDFCAYLDSVTPKQYLIRERLSDPEFGPLMDRVMGLGPKGRARLQKFLLGRPSVKKAKNEHTEKVEEAIDD